VVGSLIGYLAARAGVGTREHQALGSGMLLPAVSFALIGQMGM
jgi:hypothetical protein